MNMKRKQAVVMRAPRLEGDSIPSMATTVEAGGRESGWLIARPLVFTLVTALGPGQMELHEAPFSLGLFNSTVLSPPWDKPGFSWDTEGYSNSWALIGCISTATSRAQSTCLLQTPAH